MCEKDIISAPSTKIRSITFIVVSCNAGMTISKPLQISALWARVSAKLLTGAQSPKEVQGLGNLLNDDKVCGRSEERPKKTLSSEAS
jgi:hypothetical protein